ncbi:MAG: radical SAM protein [Chlorobiales bacterium]|nr:radical SAM protein [Chlorobiales bacterium]
MNEQIQLLIKSGTVCNLACLYCGDEVSGQKYRMQLPTLIELAGQIASLPKSSIVVAWHGGEPLTAGQSYFIRAIEILQSHLGPNQTLLTCVHTNGLLINESWMALFESIQAAVSISLDGPDEFNDRYRRSEDGNGSFKNVLAALHIAAESDIGVSVSATVHDDSWMIAPDLLDICRSQRVNQLHFEPRVNRGSLRMVRSVSVMAFSQFVSALNATRKGNEIYSDIEIPTLGEWSSPGEGKPSSCMFCRERCFSNLAIDWLGDVYPCDLFHGNASMCIGNIHTRPLSKILSDDKYLLYKRSASVIPAICRSCPWAEKCCGGCPYHRYMAFGTFERPSLYCCRAL